MWRDFVIGENDTGIPGTYQLDSSSTAISGMWIIFQNFVRFVFCVLWISDLLSATCSSRSASDSMLWVMELTPYWTNPLWVMGNVYKRFISVNKKMWKAGTTNWPTENQAEHQNTGLETRWFSVIFYKNHIESIWFFDLRVLPLPIGRKTSSTQTTNTAWACQSAPPCRFGDELWTPTPMPVNFG